MIEVIKKEWTAKFILFFLVLFSIWWLYIQFLTSGEQQHNLRDLFTVTYGLMALFGAITGVFIANRWGGFNSVLGGAIIMFSLGLFAQEFGQLVYTYYIYFLKIEVPYPSWGDLGYFGSIPLYTYGVWLLSKVSGVKFTLASIKKKIIAIIIPLIFLSISYYFFLNNYEFDWKYPLKVFLDFGYPLGQASYVSMTALTYVLTRGVLGGIMKSKVLFILFALLAEYVADWTFLYQASRGTWSVSGINDYMYFVAYFLMALALISLGSALSKLKEG